VQCPSPAGPLQHERRVRFCDVCTHFIHRCTCRCAHDVYGLVGICNLSSAPPEQCPCSALSRAKACSAGPQMDADVRTFLASTRVGRAHGHLSLRTVCGCNDGRGGGAHAPVPPPLPMCRETFERPFVGESKSEAGRPDHEVTSERFLLQCAAHANEEYLVRRATQRSCSAFAAARDMHDFAVHLAWIGCVSDPDHATVELQIDMQLAQYERCRMTFVRLVA
jgi:hypothetical protein